MNNTMTAHAAEPINYLDSIINEEEKRCDQYSHQWRNFTISRSGRFKSKNKKRDVVDGKLFDVNAAAAAATTTTGGSSVSSSSSSAMSRDDGSRKTMGNAHFTDYDKYTTRYQQQSNNKTFPPQQSQQQQQQQQSSMNARGIRGGGRTGGTFKSFYETNL